MQPNQNQTQQQYTVDYLNQIASPPKKSLENKKFFLLVGGGLVLAIIVGIVIVSNTNSRSTQTMQTLAARLQTLQTVANKAQKTIKSSSLRSTNSNLTIFLTNANRDIATPLKNNGVDITKIDKNITAAEKGETLQTTLENARLNAIFDRTYSREMSYQLDTVASLMKDIYNKTNSKSLKDFLENTDKNLQPIKKQLYEFNATMG